MKYYFCTSLFLLLALIASISAAQGSLNVDFVGCMPGTVEDVHIKDDLAFCATQGGMLVLDVSSATDPVQVSFLPLYLESDYSFGNYQGITVDGDYAYLVAWWGVLQIVDISNPAAPFMAGTCDIIEHGFDVVAGDGYAYVTDESNGLRIIDVSNPALAHQVGFLPLPSHGQGLVLDGTTVYVAADLAGLRIIDVSDPTAPVEIGFCDTPGNNRDVAIAGDFAFVTGGTGIRIVDISEPALPVEVSAFSVSGAGSTYDVDVVGRYTYISYVSGSMRIVDISDPLVPFEVGYCEFYDFHTHLMVSGQHAFVASGYRGLHIVDIEKPDVPTVVGWYFTLGIVSDVQIQGDHAYVAGGYTCDAKDSAPKEGVSGLFTVDIDELATPALTGYSPIYAPTVVTAVDGSLVCVTSGYDGFFTYDASDPAVPVEVSSLDLGGTMFGMEIVGDLAYLGGFGLRIMDLSDPSSPVELGHFHEHQAVSGLEIVGQYAYLTEIYNGLIVVDISDPADPQEVGGATTPNDTEGVAVIGDYAYVADRLEGLIVFDVHDPTDPVQIGACQTPGYVETIAAAGNFVYIVTWQDGIRVIDVSVPSAPVEVGYNTMLMPILNVTAEADYIYLACGYGGIFILRNELAVDVDPDGSTPVSPLRYALQQNHPNPFNPQTQITYDLPRETAVTLSVYNLAGRLVEVLVNRENQSAGRHRLTWDGCGAQGRQMPSGTYFYRLEAGEYCETRRMMLIR